MVEKEIIDDWQERFPILSPYTPSTLSSNACHYGRIPYRKETSPFFTQNFGVRMEPSFL